jgi:hypothetical protein
VAIADDWARNHHPPAGEIVRQRANRSRGKTQPSQLGAIRETVTSPLAIASATGEGLDIIGQH